MSEPIDTAVRAANTEFYRALEAGDLDAMAALWLHDAEAVCTHPGRQPLRGWDEVFDSWRRIFGAGGNPQVIVTDEKVDRRGDVAWVTATENLISAGQTGAASALNLFLLVDGAWRLKVHHAAPVLS